MDLTDRVAIVLDSAKTSPPSRRLEAARWGLGPSWAKDQRIGARAFTPNVKRPPERLTPPPA